MPSLDTRPYNRVIRAAIRAGKVPSECPRDPLETARFVTATAMVQAEHYGMPRPRVSARVCTTALDLLVAGWSACEGDPRIASVVTSLGGGRIRADDHIASWVYLLAPFEQAIVVDAGLQRTSAVAITASGDVRRVSCSILAGCGRRRPSVSRWHRVVGLGWLAPAAMTQHEMEARVGSPPWSHWGVVPTWWAHLERDEIVARFRSVE